MGVSELASDGIPRSGERGYSLVLRILEGDGFMLSHLIRWRLKLAALLLIVGVLANGRCRAGEEFPPELTRFQPADRIKKRRLRFWALVFLRFIGK